MCATRGGQRTMCKSQLSLPLHGFQGLSTDHQAWGRGPSPHSLVHSTQWSSDLHMGALHLYTYTIKNVIEHFTLIDALAEHPISLPSTHTQCSQLPVVTAPEGRMLFRPRQHRTHVHTPPTGTHVPILFKISKKNLKIWVKEEE